MDERDISLCWLDENLMYLLLFCVMKGLSDVVHIFGHPSLPKRSWCCATLLRLNHDYYFGVIYYLGEDSRVPLQLTRKSALFGARYELSFRECGLSRTSWEILLLR